MSIMFTNQVSSLNAAQILGGGIGRSGTGSEQRPAQSAADGHRDRAATTANVQAVSSKQESELRQVLHRLRTYVPAESAVGPGSHVAAFGSTSEVGRLVEYLSTVAAVISAPAPVVAEADNETDVTAGLIDDAAAQSAGSADASDMSPFEALAHDVNAALTAAAEASSRGDLGAAHAALSQTAARVGAATSAVTSASSATRVAATSSQLIVSSPDVAVSVQGNSAPHAVLSLVA